jgi:hypothetical protein
LPGGTGNVQEEPPSGKLVTTPRFEPGTSQVQSGSAAVFGSKNVGFICVCIAQWHSKQNSYHVPEYGILFRLFQAKFMEFIILCYLHFIVVMY